MKSDENRLVTALKGVGAKCAERLTQLSIITIQDLLFHLPFRYEDRTRITPFSAARVGDRVLIEGYVESVEIVGKKRYLF